MEDVLSSNNENIYTKDKEDIFVNIKNVMLFQIILKTRKYLPRSLMTKWNNKVDAICDRKSDKVQLES